MKYFYNLIFVMIVALLMYSCAERAICPAYQSAFIHDQAELDRHFSYFGEDSLPKVYAASKDKFLIIEREPYRKKVRSLNTVPMKTIYPVLDDSTQLAGDVQMLTEMDVVDSVALDSAMQNTLPWKEKFNVEQEFYLHYFNDILVYPEERMQAELDRKSKMETSATKLDVKKQPFFKRVFGGLFGKDENDSASLTNGAEESSDKQGFFSKLFSGKNKEDTSEGAEDQSEIEEDASDQNEADESDTDGEDDF